MRRTAYTIVYNYIIPYNTCIIICSHSTWSKRVPYKTYMYIIISIQFNSIYSDNKWQKSQKSCVSRNNNIYTRQDEHMHIHTVFTAIYKSTYIKYIYRYEYNNLDPPLDMLKHSIIIFISVWQNTYQTVSASGKLKLSS